MKKMKLSSKKTLVQLYNERKKSHKSLIPSSKRLSLSTSANLKINKGHLEQRESTISSRITTIKSKTSSSNNNNKWRRL